MANKYIGLDLGTATIKGITISENGGVMEVTNAFSLPMPEDAMMNSVIINYADISSQISELTVAGNFPKIPVALAIKGTSTVIKSVNVPIVNYNTFDEDLRFFAHQYMSINYDDYTIDYEVVSIDKTTALARVIYAATRRDILSDYISVLESAGQKLSVVDVEALALCNLYEYMKLPKSGHSLIIDIGLSSTECIFLKEGIFSYQDSVMTAGHMCTELLKKKTKIPLESVDLVKANPDAFPTGDAVKKVIADEYLPELLREIEQAISKYRILGGDIPENIYLSGSGATTLGLQNSLMEIYKGNVDVMDPKKIIRIEHTMANQILELKPAALNVAIAMALR